mmetsp:Transcript_3024/g.6270  ORF Transcript_3024/g.6270 Transcript_3024/m.6270 type:complete len:353 (-) Transcript_3024:304-1362(-)|eukprot:CAMPEP_0194304856 /NCGR_PEP_ID=MMETSP0171-20130528/2457_1 /TAXON_ID=218684 /ORGANISM="Corethron pennatum, Strain L29A3" /LENGTH=352 /DNA_ID=CAMNT_0039056227 /DNA_START=39 /DNA_END=1097 /DNA_ORIENTATION=+
MSSSDAPPPLYPVGSYVTIHSTSRDDLNGRCGRVEESASGSDGRYRIVVHADPVMTLSLKSERLQPASAVERAKATAQYGVFVAKQKFDSPEGTAVRAEASRLLEALRVKLPRWMSPRTFFMVVVLLLITFVRVIGFMRFLVFFGIVYGTVIVAFPDISVSTGSPKERVRKIAAMFPTRLRYAIGDATGYRNVSGRVAVGIYVAFVFLSLWVALQSSSPSTPLSNVPTGTPAYSAAPPRLDLLAVYKAGFDDAAAGLEYGTNLPEPSPALEEYDESSYDSPSHFTPPAPKASKFGIGNIMSLLYVGRTIQTLATGPDGRITPASFVFNVRAMQPISAGLFALSLYRIVKAVL